MKKVLILSHNPITTFEGMGKTMLQLFRAFDPQELCQLYLYPTIPDVQMCASYYRITDKDVLKSYLHFGRVKGGVIAPERISGEKPSLFEEQKDEKLYRNRKNGTATRRLCRDLMWKFARWYNADLRRWLDEQSPEVIFVAPGVGIFLYRMALRISKARNIPIVTYLCDDFYFLQTGSSLFERLHAAWLRRQTRSLLHASRHIVFICEEIRARFAQEFDVPGTVIMTGSDRPIADFPLRRPQPERITYLGNIRFDRYRSLAQLGKALEEYNSRRGTDYRLDIYSVEKDPEILKPLRACPAICLCGFVTGEEYERVFRNSQLLLHTEAFDGRNIDRVKDSVSTKIAESLGSGLCLLAYGPEEVASMRHLLRHKCALTATSPEELPTLLELAFENDSARKTAVENALQTARVYHDSEKNSLRLRALLEAL